MAFAGGAPGAGLPAPEPPRWLRLTPWNPFLMPPALPESNPLSALESVNLEVEAQRESRRSANSTTTTTVDRLFIAPTVSLAEKGSIYHPNLFQFVARGDLGYGWQQFHNSSGSPASWEENSFLNRYDLDAIILRSKPYATAFSAEKVHTFRDLDLFNRVTVDSQTYGGRTGYSAGPVPVSLSFTHLEEDQTDVDQRSHLEQDIAEFKARNERSARSRSDLFYSYGNYLRQTPPSFEDQSTYHYASFDDTERWGHGERFVLTSSLYYNQVESETLPSKSLNAGEFFSIEHSKTLQSFYDYSFNGFSASPADTYSHYARSAVRHQLYDSLSSQFELRGSAVQTQSPGGSQDQWRVGVGWDETYTKRLGSWGRLTVGSSLRVDREQRNVSGTQLVIPNERHTLVNGETFLNQPNVIAVLQVTDTNSLTSYQLGTDYETIRFGSLMQIKRIPTSLLLTNDSAPILVTYSVSLAPGTGEGSFIVFSEQFQVRLDLWQNLLGLYSRLYWVENYGGEQFVLENTFDTQSGAELSGRWFRIGGEYETRDSNLIRYRAINVHESFFFTPTDFSTLGVDLRQRWADYPDEDRNVTDYSFTLRHHIRFARYLTHSLEGGVRWEEGDGTEQRQAVARTELGLAAGKLRLLLGYQFNNDEIRGDLTIKHFTYLQLRRAL